ncbi:MAG: DUF4252 domain-containing protein [bacterium]|nr:DUF4252 domain-containing protein [bacterium]
MKSLRFCSCERFRTVAAVISSFIIVVMTSGCMTARTANRVTAELENEIPELRLEREFSLTLGRMSLAIVRTAIKISGDVVDEQEMEILRGLRRAEVGVYRVIDDLPVDARPRLAAFGNRFVKNGWHNIVRTTEHQGHVWIYGKPDDNGDLRGLLVIALEDDELVVVRLDGRLQEALTKATMDDPQGFVEALESS